MRIYFARHGESEANVQEVFWNRSAGYGLTDTGRAQARALSRTLSDIPFAALYCSPILRARQTAAIVGQKLDLEPEPADGLREWDVGILEGRTYTEETQALHRRTTEAWLVHGDLNARIEGGESYVDIAARFEPFIAHLVAIYGATQDNVLLISHGGLLVTMLPELLTNVDVVSALRWGCPYASPIVAERRGGEWVCLRWGDLVP